jgi:hypothetical protein
MHFIIPTSFQQKKCISFAWRQRGFSNFKRKTTALPIILRTISIGKELDRGAVGEMLILLQLRVGRGRVCINRAPRYRAIMIAGKHTHSLELLHTHALSPHPPQDEWPLRKYFGDMQTPPPERKKLIKNNSNLAARDFIIINRKIPLQGARL